MYPEILYKYRALNEYTLMSLVNRSVWFSNPSFLNDPFDCQIKIDNTVPSKEKFEVDIGKAIEKIASKTYGTCSIDMPDPAVCYKNGNLSDEIIKEVNSYKDYIESDLKKIGVLSLSADPENTTMWSHYAHNHTGICIGYKTKDIFKKNKLSQILHKVEYQPKETINFNAFDIYTQTCCNNDKEEIQKIRSEIFSTKSDDWEYEKEWRMISGSPGNVHCGDNVIYSIQFGLKCSIDMKITVRNILADTSMVYFQMVRTPSGLGLEPVNMGKESEFWSSCPE